MKLDQYGWKKSMKKSSLNYFYIYRHGKRAALLTYTVEPDTWRVYRYYNSYYGLTCTCKEEPTIEQIKAFVREAK